MSTAADATQQLTPTGRVILGMIRLGRRTGYEIKQLVDVSARFFWTASYGQIYPELKRLEEAGLIAGEPDPAGGRARTVYSLTESGERALDTWLDSDAELVWELRDEGLLKLFFSGDRDRESVRAHMRAARERSEAVAGQLRAVALDKGASEDDLAAAEPGPLMVLRFGIEFNEWLAGWWARAEER